MLTNATLNTISRVVGVDPNGGGLQLAAPETIGVGVMSEELTDARRKAIGEQVSTAEVVVHVPLRLNGVLVLGDVAAGSVVSVTHRALGTTRSWEVVHVRTHAKLSHIDTQSLYAKAVSA
jgi:hypothetical protein